MILASKLRHVVREKPTEPKMKDMALQFRPMHYLTQSGNISLQGEIEGLFRRNLTTISCTTSSTTVVNPLSAFKTSIKQDLLII